MKYVLAVANDCEELLAKIRVPGNCFIHIRSSVRQVARLVLAAVPDLVLIEHALPDGSGLTVVETLRSHLNGWHVPVVVLGAEEPDPYQKLGCSYFLPAKPTARDLNQVLSVLLCNADSLRLSSLSSLSNGIRRDDPLPGRQFSRIREAQTLYENANQMN